MSDASVRAAGLARTSYGRLLALLAARTRDIAGAEDALAEAFAAALVAWPEFGVPDAPEAWLLTTARNKLTDQMRRAARIDVTDALPEKAPEMYSETASEFPDERLRLMLVCAHPAIDPSLHAPLMMQTVLGVEAADIARVFAISPSALAQRLVRAKRKIKDAGIPFVLPETSALPERLTPVLNAIYAAFTVDWIDGPAGNEALREEALYLADVLVRLVPRSAEVLGLAALLTYSLAREPARIVGGIFVALPDQQVELWDIELRNRAEILLSRASGLQQIGRFQLEASIQAVHMARLATGVTDWHAVRQLLTGLMQIAPSLGAAVALAAAALEDVGPEAAIRQLDSIADRAERFQPYWATCAACLRRLGKLDDALSANATAVHLSDSEILQIWLERRAQSWRGALN